jgi:hypothetical protein
MLLAIRHADSYSKFIFVTASDAPVAMKHRVMNQSTKLKNSVFMSLKCTMANAFSDFLI